MRARAGKSATRRSHSSLAGGHASALRGRGMDYAESRAYEAGDDARNIDWRRTARSGKWHTKLFEAEREHGLLLLVDTHATMRFGTRARYKSVAAARAAAWIAWTCVRAGDRIGAMAFGAVRSAVDLHSGTRGALSVLGALARWDAAPAAAGADMAEPLSAALARAQRLITPGSRAWLLSDGWCADAAAAQALARLARHADVRAAIVVDALERDPVHAGTYVFETASEKRVVDLADAKARARFGERMSQGWRQLAEACNQAAVPWIPFATTDEPDIAITPLWRRRVGRR
ncbi:MAG TPA: DUF58 domain-containing protein [Rhodanobacteraceae bacterium]|nr:DUF58 domain-containing protein [Rhodanobacteraceae bacterium]